MKNFDLIKFISAWFIAAHLVIMPWIFCFFFFLLLWPNIASSMLAILYTGVLCFGIPFTLLAEKQHSRKRLKFIIVGAVCGQISPLLALAIIKVTPLYNIFGIIELDPLAFGIGMFTGSIHGLFCAYIYHRIYYKS